MTVAKVRIRTHASSVSLGFFNDSCHEVLEIARIDGVSVSWQFRIVGGRPILRPLQQMFEKLRIHRLVQLVLNVGHVRLFDLQGAGQRAASCAQTTLRGCRCRSVIEIVGSDNSSRCPSP